LPGAAGVSSISWAANHSFPLLLDADVARLAPVRAFVGA